MEQTKHINKPCVRNVKFFTPEKGDEFSKFTAAWRSLWLQMKLDSKYGRQLRTSDKGWSFRVWELGGS